eukprot:1971811-Amphidinium_carterae.1
MLLSEGSSGVAASLHMQPAWISTTLVYCLNLSSPPEHVSVQCRTHMLVMQRLVISSKSGMSPNDMDATTYLQESGTIPNELISAHFYLLVSGRVHAQQWFSKCVQN